MFVLPRKSLVVVAAVVMALLVSGCASSGGKKKSKRISLYHLIKDSQYDEATSRLETLYANYPSSVKAESQFTREVNGAVSYLPKKHERQLQQFIKFNRHHVAGKFFAAVHFQNVGLKVRGTDSASDTPRKKLDAMQQGVSNSIARFQAVLEEDSGSYLAHMYNGRNYAYNGIRKNKAESYQAALAIRPANYFVWKDYLFYNQARWGGTFEKTEQLIEQMAAQESVNPKLRRLRGYALADRASEATRQGQYAQAEEHIFNAYEFGITPRYGRVVGGLVYKVRESGDQKSVCRIAKKVNVIYPDNKEFQKMVADCT